ncbi:MAG: hypothetical protein NC822_00515 [Candidatus Omnitrophica bacterium]|nr:hypothetical protein [Candidatus Omnitrophota bacterium]MCM8826546.1 hypothetical protein [Candidatus Omnitrophota bacterium]
MMRKKGIVLVVVVGIMLIIIILSLAGIYLMREQTNLSENKIRRIRAYYAAYAGVVDTLARLYNGQIAIPNIAPINRTITVDTDNDGVAETTVNITISLPTPIGSQITATVGY